MNSDSQITVFGATGQVGRQVVALLLARGYWVVAAIHGDSHFPAHDRLSTVSVDIYDSTSVAKALEGSTLVVSALGSWGTKRKDVLTAGMQAIIPAMNAQSIHRIVSLTGADARAAGDQLGIIHRLMHIAIGVMAPKILRDGERHIALLEASNLDWTALRSPIMSSRDGVGNGELTMRRPLPWQRISRSYVANAIVTLIADTTQSNQAPYIR